MWTRLRTKYRVVHSHVNASKHHISRGSAKQYSIYHTAPNQATFHILSASAKQDNAVSFFVQASHVFSFSKRAILVTQKNPPCHPKCDNPQNQLNKISKRLITWFINRKQIRLWTCGRKCSSGLSRCGWCRLVLFEVYLSSPSCFWFYKPIQQKLDVPIVGSVKNSTDKKLTRRNSTEAKFRNLPLNSEKCH